MKSMSPILAALACAAALTACGGGSKAPATPAVVQPAFSKTDTVTGTGAEADAGDLATIQYSAYLYSATAADHHGTLFDNTYLRNLPATFTIGSGLSVPAGLDQGTTGMKVGGHRVVVLPANLGFGTTDTGAGINGPVLPGATAGVVIPSNSPLIYEVDLIGVQKAPPVVTVPVPTTLGIYPTATGSGTAVVSGNTLVVHYTGWLFDGTKSDLKGAQFDTDNGAGFTFIIGTGAVIAGWDQGLIGMLPGGKRTLVIPASLAYGANGSATIPPNTALVFDVQLVSAK
ncbi:FKBP-type peptidyl-prolyl cis-trans isomerase [Rugamonas sp.]|uniref:FKBP-type peptidyl-prolyl cis-trans isomerase n=1 Tax=Rugamonas sp. TaxID=1926287 RepID=UPI0025F2898C|nr:FKBP-type peptidyl-prolyl cis-trans isomerase [Rugamonas sp.]